MMKQTLIQRIAMLFPCNGQQLTEADDFRDDECQYLEGLLPSGSGIDCGMEIDIEQSTRRNIRLTGDYHYMDENGFYGGWFSFAIVFTSNIASGTTIDNFEVTSNGTDLSEDDINTLFEDYLCETVRYATMELKEVALDESLGHCILK